MATNPQTCTSFIYSNWGSCNNNIQTRSVISSLPQGCIGGNPVLNQNCNGSNNSIVCDPLDVYRKVVIDLVDFVNLAEKIGMNCSDNPSSYTTLCGPLDSNKDNKINIIDFTNFASKYGKTCS